MADALWDVQLAPRVRRILERIRDKAVLRRLRAAVEGLAVAPYKGQRLDGSPGRPEPGGSPRRAGSSASSTSSTRQIGASSLP